MKIDNFDDLMEQHDARIDNLVTGYKSQQIVVVIRSTNTIEDLPEIGDKFVLTRKEVELNKGMVSVIQLFLSKVSDNAD